MLELNKIYNADCLIKLKELDENSIDVCITDPPYGLEFMGKEWDKFDNKTMGKKLMTKRDAHSDSSIGRKNDPFIGASVDKYIAGKPFQDFCFQWATEVLRVLKPGGHLLAFGGSRTYHRIACAIEDAGFEIRDMIEWVYGSGFPKSLNIAKTIEKQKGVQGKIINQKTYPDIRNNNYNNSHGKTRLSGGDYLPVTEQAKYWDGWGTALKPAHEPICIARKPISEKNIALNVLKWGTGGINIDGCRIEFQNDADKKETTDKNQHLDFNSNDGIRVPTKGIYHGDFRPPANYDNSKGRFPANLIHDGSDEVMKEFNRNGETASGKIINEKDSYEGDSNTEFLRGKTTFDNQYGDSGTPARFFYTAKASKSERGQTNGHPTVKPLALMKYLVTMFSREGQIVLDCFAGSGTTLKACQELNRNYIGIEKEKEYFEICEKRLEMKQGKLL